MKVAVAFGGGGARALGSLGAIRVLEKYEISAVAGTSMGAIIAAYYGVHGEVDSLREWFEKLNTRKIISHYGSPSKHALIGTKNLRKLFEEWFGDLQLEELSLPVKIVATSLNKKEERVFTRGSVVDCVLASMAIPGLFPPVRIGDEFFVDGGITNPTPLSALSRYRRVFGIDFSVREQEFKEPPTIFESLFYSYEVARHVAVQNQKKGKKYLVISPKPMSGIQILRFDKAKEHILAGEEAAKKFISQNSLA